MSEWEAKGLGEIKEYLTLIGRISSQPNYHAYLLAHGKTFTHTRSSRSFGGFGKVKECYINAQRAAINDPRLHYYEGLGYSEGLIPVDHAWNVYRGVVIDPTWERFNRPTVYFGMRIPTDYIERHWVKTGMAENLLARYLFSVGKVKVTPRINNPELPPASADSMLEAISLTSPSGTMSKRARKAANERLRIALFGKEGLVGPQSPEQPSSREYLLRRAAELRGLAERGMHPRKYRKEADRLETLAGVVQNRGL